MSRCGHLLRVQGGRDQLVLSPLPVVVIDVVVVVVDAVVVVVVVVVVEVMCAE